MVKVRGECVGEIGQGLLVFLGVGVEDRSEDSEYLAGKIANLRIFPDDKNLMNRSLAQVNGGVLVVSQFTLWGNCHKGRRPSFSRAAPAEKAKELYQDFVRTLRGKGLKVGTGVFQEQMDVHLVNDGPVTLLLDSRRTF